MSDLPSILPISWQEQIGWTLIHSVWQIALIAAFYAMASLILRQKSANVRYVLGCAALLAMISAPIATFLYAIPAISRAQEQTTDGGNTVVLSDVENRTVEGVSLQAGAFELEVVPHNSAATEPNLISAIPETGVATPLTLSYFPALFEALLSWLSIGWLVGVAVLTLRPLLGFYTVHRLRTRGLTPLSEELRQLAGRLLMRLKINQAVQFAESALVQVPSVVGYLRPMVLLPASAVTGLGIDQLELLLAHELAHVRRHDYLINLLQTIVETLLFYHPAMWWLSVQIRKERECCCDDMVVALCGNRQAYIRTLWAMENQRDAVVPMLAMSGGSLVDRIRRLAFGQPAGSQYGAGWLGSFVVLGLIVLLLSLGQTFAEDAAVEAPNETTAQVAEEQEAEEQEAQSADENDQAASQDAAADKLIAKLPTYKECSIKKALQARIHIALDEIEERNEGHVIVGRVKVEAVDDPTLAYAQMEILQDGYFAGPVANLVDPVGFRMHQYAPYDLDLRAHRGKLIDVGTIQMRRLPEAELSPILGRVAMEGDGDLGTVSVFLDVTDSPINSPSGGTEPRSRSAEPIKMPLDSAGRFYLPAFSPIRYHVFLSAPGYVSQHFPVDVKANDVTNLKTITLEKPRQIWLEYVVAEQSPFDLEQVRRTVLQGGGRWQFTPHPHRWDLEFDQRKGRLYFDWSYGPIFLADLGSGELRDFQGIEGGVATQHPREFAVTDGNVYLARRPNWERGQSEDLVLFKIRLEKRDDEQEEFEPVEQSPENPAQNQSVRPGPIVETTDINQLDREGFSALHRAASGGHVERIHDLLVKGADVNVRQGTFLGTPLQYAAHQGHGEAVQELLDHRATVDARDANGRTPLIWAAMAGHADVARRLLDAGADVNTSNEGGWTPLHYAASRDHQQMVQLLISRGADDFALNTLGKTPREFAVANADLRQLLGEVRQTLPEGWQAEITPDVPARFKPPWQQNANPCLVVWRTEPTPGEPIAPGMPAGAGPDDRPWAPVHPRFYLANVEFLSLEQYSVPARQNRENLVQRNQFVASRLSGIPRDEKEATPPRPGTFRPQNEAQEALVREYAHLWVQTEPKQLPTHFYRSLAFIFETEAYNLRDKAIGGEYESLEKALLSLLTSYDAAADRLQPPSVAFASPRSLASSDRPATIAPTPPPVDEHFWPVVTDPNQVIATVLGREILQQEMNPPLKWVKTREEHLRTHGQTPGLESLEQFHRRRLFELTAKPLIEAYKEKHNLEPTEEEIEEFIAQYAIVRSKRTKENEQKLEKLRADETKLASSQVPLSQQPETLKQLEAIRKEIDAVEKVMAFTHERQSRDEKFQRHFAKWQLDHWKLHSTLYKQYGGRVVWQQVGNEAIDALRDFFREEEAKGRLVIHDEKLRRMFWEPFTQEKLSFVVSDPERVFTQPWPVDRSSDGE